MHLVWIMFVMYVRYVTYGKANLPPYVPIWKPSFWTALQFYCIGFPRTRFKRCVVFIVQPCPCSEGWTIKNCPFQLFWTGRWSELGAKAARKMQAMTTQAEYPRRQLKSQFCLKVVCAKRCKIEGLCCRKWSSCSRGGKFMHYPTFFISTQSEL